VKGGSLGVSSSNSDECHTEFILAGEETRHFVAAVRPVEPNQKIFVRNNRPWTSLQPTRSWAASIKAITLSLRQRLLIS
jgi:hypothetical protein